MSKTTNKANSQANSQANKETTKKQAEKATEAKSTKLKAAKATPKKTETVTEKTIVHETSEKKNAMNISEAELKRKIENKLFAFGVTDPKKASAEQLYNATVNSLKEIMVDSRAKFNRRIAAQEGKKVCYLCMEFLVGRMLKNNVMNMGIYDKLDRILNEFGSSFDEIYACEVDPGLGNGGLGRLAACFMDSLTALNYAANGYSLLYENGLFKQRLVDGEQVELPDVWIPNGGAWLVAHPEKTMTVRFGGDISETWENGELRITHTNYDEVKAVPYDLLIVGPDTDAVNSIRLWRAKNAQGTEAYPQTQGEYIKAHEKNSNAEEITRQLYPPDNYDEGKLLRLTQQYFLVSASLQSIIRDYFAANGSLDNFEDKIALHINDTHPALCIPELMRILMDVYSYSWDDAWKIVTKSVSYTNHTVLPEALECWKIDLFKLKLPRIFSIVTEINRRFCADLWNMYPGDWDRISRMAIVGYGQVKMANLCVVGSHTVNGVSQLHSEILKKTVFHDFYKMTPWKFTNVTNGIVHRRWLCYSNPGLSSLLTSTIGDGFMSQPSELRKFEKFATDDEVLLRLNSVKRENKVRLSNYIKEKTGRNVDPDSVFDVQIKRMHEYKRQLLNVLKIISIYNEVCDNPNANIMPETFIFGAKAAPSYFMAKRLIKLIYFLSRELENNPATKDKIKVVFMEDYNVSMAEIIIPSADISEQISLAGKEASGTSNMKLMLNGALTMGTLDGANVEILDAVGDRNIYIFGLNTYEVDELWRHGYEAREYYRNSDVIRRAVDRLNSKIGGEDFSDIADYLINGTHSVADPYMCLADFSAYRYEHDRAMSDYRDRLEWARKSLINIARAGRFAADNSIRTYANEIWHLTPIGK